MRITVLLFIIFAARSFGQPGVEDEVGVPSGWVRIRPSAAYETVTVDQALGTSIVMRARLLYSFTADGETTRTVMTPIRVMLKGPGRSVRRLRPGVRMFNGRWYANKKFRRDRRIERERPTTRDRPVGKLEDAPRVRLRPAAVDRGGSRRR